MKITKPTAQISTYRGTFDSLNDACEFVRVIEKRQAQKVGCIEEVGIPHGFYYPGAIA